MAATGPLTRAQRLGAVSSLVQVIFHRRWYCSGMGRANRSLCMVRQCCRITVRSGSQQLPSPKLNTTSTLPSCCLLPARAAWERRLRSCLGLRPSPWCPQMAAERLPILETRTLWATLLTRRVCSLAPRVRPFCACALPAPACVLRAPRH